MKSILLVALLTFSSFANAVIINETTWPQLTTTFIDNGQTQLDTTTGLEWLNFSNLTDGTNEFMTMGYSINDSLTNFGSYGFRLASESDVIGLFSTIYPSFNGGSNGIMSFAEGDGTSEIIQRRNSWLLSFGTDGNSDDAGITITSTVDGGTSMTVSSGSLSSRGMYEDSFGNIQYAGVLLNVDTATTKIYGPDFQTSFNLDRNSAYSNLGVFMVRDYVPAVPIPAAVWLFLSGLIGLVAVARRKA